MNRFRWAFPILAISLLCLPSMAQLIPPSQRPAQEPPGSRLTAKDNGGTVVVPGERFVVALPHRARFEWKPLPAATDATPHELEALRKYEADESPGPGVGKSQMQLSTFELPIRKDGPIKLELIYTDLRDPSKAPRDGKLYKPEGDDYSQKVNHPHPNMRFVVSLKRP